MQIAMTIAPQDWMTDAKAMRVMTVLGGLKDTPEALFVGGCVRNTLLSKPVADIDIATIHRPDKVMQILLDAGIRAIPTGLEHGTVTALIEDKIFEITTLRRDVETDGRHAVIAFTDKWEKDAERRDFTINSLLASHDGKIFDPTGHGIADIQKRRVVFIGQPEQRIAEDYLRILRFFRFHGQYGKGDPDAESLNACRAHADKLKKLSRERVTQEFFKILSLSTASDILEWMNGAGVMSSVRVPTYHVAKMEKLCKIQTRYDAVDIFARLALLSGFDSERLQEWFVLSNAQKSKLALIDKAYKAMSSPNTKKIRALVYEFGNEVATQTYLLWLAIEDMNPNLENMDAARYWQAPVFPITGNDLMAKGLEPGKYLGKKLKTLEDKWIKSDFKDLPNVE